jgi:hypothetical protein
MTIRLFLALSLTATLVSGCWKGYSISANNHKCPPPAYPGMSVSPMIARESVRSTTTDTVDKVRDGYINQIKPDPWLGPSTGALWTYRQRGNKYLFECVNVPNGYEIEVGCVFLTPASLGTSIERMWDITEGGVNCTSLLHAPAEFDRP